MSDTINITEGEFPLDQTLCMDCEYRLSKVIIPLDYDDFDIDIDALEDPDEDIEISQHSCLKTGQDMNYLVIECSKYTPEKKGNLLRHDIT